MEFHIGGDVGKGRDLTYSKKWIKLHPILRANLCIVGDGTTSYSVVATSAQGAGRGDGPVGGRTSGAGASALGASHEVTPGP